MIGAGHAGLAASRLLTDRSIDHIVLDERGIAYIRNTTLKVADLAIDTEVWHLTLDQIRDNYPRLSLAQIHAALSYYHDHREEIDRFIAEQTEEYERLRAASPPQLTRQHLEERLKRRRDATGSE